MQLTAQDSFTLEKVGTINKHPSHQHGEPSPKEDEVTVHVVLGFSQSMYTQTLVKEYVPESKDDKIFEAYFTDTLKENQTAILTGTFVTPACYQNLAIRAKMPIIHCTMTNLLDEVFSTADRALIVVHKTTFEVFADNRHILDAIGFNHISYNNKIIVVIDPTMPGQNNLSYVVNRNWA